MGKTRIEWCDESINPVKGLCPVGCSYCYARRMYKRFRWNPEIRYEPIVLNKLMEAKPMKIFWGSTIDLFHKKTIQYLPRIFAAVAILKQHTHIFLTKCPENLPKEFPSNCWVGISTNGCDSRSGLEDIFKDIRAKVKFVSIEPLLSYTPMDFRWVNWVIIGRQTPLSEKTKPSLNWVHDIVVGCDKLSKPVFLKNNLQSLILGKQNNGWATKYIGAGDYELRQEYPIK